MLNRLPEPSIGADEWMHFVRNRRSDGNHSVARSKAAEFLNRTCPYRQPLLRVSLSSLHTDKRTAPVRGDGSSERGCACDCLSPRSTVLVKHSGWIRGCLIRRKAPQEHLSSLFYYYHSFQFLCADEILLWRKGPKFGSASVTSKSSLRLTGWSLLETSFRLN